jgi:hypothetical protein
MYNQWKYSWTVSSTNSTEVNINTTATDDLGNSYTGTDTLNFSIYGDNQEPTVILSHNGANETYSDGDEVEITATFSEAKWAGCMTATPTIHLNGVDINTTMSATNSASIWTYNWTVSSTVSTEVSATVSGTDLNGNSYTGTDTLFFSIYVDNDEPTVALSDSDDIGIWNRKLTSSEIFQLYTGVIDTVSPIVTMSHNASPKKLL